MFRSLVLGIIMAAAPVVAMAAPPVPPVATVLRFNPGQTSQEIRGSVAGYQGPDYALNVRAGDRATIRLDGPKNVSLYFNLISPSGKTVYNGSINGNRFTGTLSESGVYSIRPYLMRNDARRGKRADFKLTIQLDSGLAGGPSRPPISDGPSFDCKKARGVIERTICDSRSLSELDSRLAFVYKDALDGAPKWKAEQIRRDHRTWLSSRDTCARRQNVVGCLTPLYQSRIGILEPKH